MKKWLVILGLSIILLSLFLVSTYQSATSKVNDDKKNAEELVVKQGYLKTVQHSDYYHGKEQAIVVSGKDNANNEMIAWIQDGNVITRKKSEGLTQKQIIDKVVNERSPKKIHKVKLGIENKIPLWEVVYIDQNGRYNFYYAAFENGELLKRYSI
ncbi:MULTISPECIES: DUF5590 domain-containing protein [unclassified Bacillus (in: firmicutes)]|uniref:cell wall elongation regulator TseB-like domain-containing protein n=1 Tax=Bacillaceae TaxID=186817 RepID=UPI000BEF7ED1|nr:MULTISPECIES: DUF5590 domain-containing protein [unclassified Bacillus (in: firmicutes)]PEJ53792.1 hypothetical protein CN692_21005 [Bacillus sp. AFS002410]PEL11699.1 hypothetical protein CN601_09830 [Bacillus sp. AFS017336]QKE71842.1 DUF5590 domain-containing protein [Arthrobacter citreus]